MECFRDQKKVTKNKGTYVLCLDRRVWSLDDLRVRRCTLSSCSGQLKRRIYRAFIESIGRKRSLLWCCISQRHKVEVTSCFPEEYRSNKGKSGQEEWC